MRSMLVIALGFWVSSANAGAPISETEPYLLTTKGPVHFQYFELKNGTPFDLSTFGEKAHWSYNNVFSAYDSNGRLTQNKDVRYSDSQAVISNRNSSCVFYPAYPEQVELRLNGTYAVYKSASYTFGLEQKVMFSVSDGISTVATISCHSLKDQEISEDDFVGVLNQGPLSMRTVAWDAWPTSDVKIVADETKLLQSLSAPILPESKIEESSSK